jgi:hypothetical protein
MELTKEQQKACEKIYEIKGPINSKGEIEVEMPSCLIGCTIKISSYKRPKETKWIQNEIQKINQTNEKSRTIQ